MPYNVIWFILLIVFIVAEVLTAGPLVSIWFCFGSLCAMVAASAGVPFYVQLIIFVVISIALLILTKPFVKKYVHKNIIKTNVEAIIGQHGVVIEDINNLDAKGAIKVAGKVWTARSISENDMIHQGEEVEIVSIEGVKAIVKKIHNDKGVV